MPYADVMIGREEYVFKAIVALNNTGVSFIRHGYYQWAIETLKDATRLMKGLVELRNIAEIRSEALTENLADYEGALQAAATRTSLIHHRTHEDVTNSTGINVIVVSEQDHPSSVAGQLAQPKQHGTALLCCVTIDPSPLDDEDDDYRSRLGQESALILYNLSIAYRCIDKIYRSPHHNDTHGQTSFQLMEYAFTAVCSMMRDLPSRGGLMMDHVPLNLFPISLLTLHNLNEMSFEHEAHHNKYIQYYVAYEYLVTVMVERFRTTAENEIVQSLSARAA